MSEWQPISSAPLDVPLLLAWRQWHNKEWELVVAVAGR